MSPNAAAAVSDGAAAAAVAGGGTEEGTVCLGLGGRFAVAPGATAGRGGAGAAASMGASTKNAFST